mmetsp:Transcript_67197/g.153924  ORF Transcript_67197/g.153924 Transcript_67197/m.153924 type:complete len:244 (-) Transcript_67197:414-1145(-)
MPAGWRKPTLGDALASTSIRGMEVAVTLANPQMDDCPLIGCSNGFTAITGYNRDEIVGRNCRFLNDGCEMAPEVRTRLRRATISGEEFVGVLMNRRKDGTPFQNLLHLTRIKVGNQSFIVGVQADVTGKDLDLMMDEGHQAEIKAVVDQLFQSNMNAWIKIQGNLFKGTSGAQLMQVAPQQTTPLKTSSSRSSPWSRARASSGRRIAWPTVRSRRSFRRRATWRGTRRTRSRARLPPPWAVAP